jgi:hypothetical protein
MSFRLKVASALASRSTIQRELARVAEVTTVVLDELLEDHAPEAIGAVRSEDMGIGDDIEGLRRAMADGHVRRVRALVEAMGEEEAVREGRRRMGPAGERLGAEARQRLGVDDSTDDLVAAAKLLYKVLDIEFEAEERDDGSVTLHIGRCGLSDEYDGVTCRLMSAADEGMMRGLNPRARMEFRSRMTEGASECLAEVTFEQEVDG